MTISNSSVSRSDLEKTLLSHLSLHSLINDSLEFLVHTFHRSDSLHDLFTGLLQSLSALNIVKLTPNTKHIYSLTNEGKEYLKNGSPEGQIYNILTKNQNVTPATLPQLLNNNAQLAKIGTAQLMKSRILTINKANGTYELKTDINFVDIVQQQLQIIETNEANSLQSKDLIDLKKRALITSTTLKTFKIEKGENFSTERTELITDLTSELLKNDSWEKAIFKSYNFNALGRLQNFGCLHPLMKVKAEFRQILLTMGFSEMTTNRWVESSFWNFDALFQPQQHPARDSHDTFFLKEPTNTLRIETFAGDENYVERVKLVHEKGGYGSIGYRYDWHTEEARKNILRTHTTACSTRLLYQLAQNHLQELKTNSNSKFRPVKYFSIDRVFRNETLDATHLAEFHQVEGLVADYGLSLADLLGTIKVFFSRIGIEDVKFKPAYNPYTEPSMEIFGYSKELEKWVEIGNSGIFRPEMLRPMGLPEDVSVIAWGLSLERPTMIKYGIKNIRDLFGPKVKLNIIQNNPIARFDD